MTVMTCHECRQPTSREESRIVWLKDLQIERRLCRGCLRRRGLSVTPRYWRAK